MPSRGMKNGAEKVECCDATSPIDGLIRANQPGPKPIVLNVTMLTEMPAVPKSVVTLRREEPDPVG